MNRRAATSTTGSVEIAGRVAANRIGRPNGATTRATSTSAASPSPAAVAVRTDGPIRRGAAPTSMGISSRRCQTGAAPPRRSGAQTRARRPRRARGRTPARTGSGPIAAYGPVRGARPGSGPEPTRAPPARKATGGRSRRLRVTPRGGAGALRPPRISTSRALSRPFPPDSCAAAVGRKAAASRASARIAAGAAPIGSGSNFGVIYGLTQGTGAMIRRWGCGARRFASPTV